MLDNSFGEDNALLANLVRLIPAPRVVKES